MTNKTTPLVPDVISLPRSLKRRRAIEFQLSASNIPFRFFDATDAESWSEEEALCVADTTLATRSLGRKMSMGELACTLSHRRLYAEIASHDRPGALVLEDDVDLSPAFAFIMDWISTQVDQLRTSKTILYLGGREGFEDLAIAFSKKPYPTPPEGFSLLRVLRSEHAIQRTCGYYISRGAAISILEREPNIYLTADSWEHRIRNSTIDALWVLSPPCIRHPLSIEDSLIEKERDVLVRNRNRLIDRYPALKPFSTSWRMAKKITRRTLVFPTLRLLY